MEKPSGNALTRHPEGSIRELWGVSLPLMISSLASLFMIFIDRIFLAHYSLETLNASVYSGTLAWAIMSGFGMITAMSEVFVAQYNGSGEKKRLGIPVWQMIWFSLALFIFFIPMAIWGAPEIFSSDRYVDLEIEYFRWLMIFGPSYALMTALAGFFIGRGQTQMMIWLGISANLINIALDAALIFGIPGLIPEMGIQGAAIATCFGYVFEGVVLAYFFLKKENRDEYGTGNCAIDWKEMAKCFKVGIPQGVFYSLEVFGWAIFYSMMTHLGEAHITVSSICQSFAIFLSFFCDGLSRGAAAVAGNLIGAKKHHLVDKVLRSGLVLLAFFSLGTALILVIDPVDTAHFLFFEQADAAIDAPMLSSLNTCMLLTFIYIFFDGIRWLFSGLLVAAGDTLFLMVAGSLSVWIFLLTPVYTIVVQNALAVEYAWSLAVLYAGIFFTLYWIRFKQGKWQKINLISEEAIEAEAVDYQFDAAEAADEQSL